MATRPLVRSIKLENYRVFRSIETGDLRRITILGGLNGTGKTTLLEAIFTLMDRMGPISLLRPFMFRNLPATLDSIKAAFFGGSEISTISSEMRHGRVVSSYVWERQKLISAAQVPNIQRVPSSDTSGEAFGITLNVTVDDKVVLIRHFLNAGGVGIQIMDEKIDVDTVPICAMLSRFTTHNQQDLVQRYSEAIQKGKRKEVIKKIREFLPEIVDLEILQVSDQVILHAELPSGSMVPVSFVGDGVLTMLSVTLAMMQCSGGAVFLDEFDAAIHYSRLPRAWEVISDAAVEFDCQVFSATHSFESIQAAVSGLKKRPKDLAYIRLDKSADRVVATRYSYEELSVADEERWEVR